MGDSELASFRTGPFEMADPALGYQDSGVYLQGLPSIPAILIASTQGCAPLALGDLRWLPPGAKR